MKLLELNSITEWRTWLAQNHNCFSEVWLVYYKKETGLPTLDYKETLDEALCYGWVDSIIKKLDEQRYARKFTPRRADSSWSLVNKTRVEELIAAGRMAAPGLAKVEAAKKSGAWENPTTKPEFEFEIHSEFARALDENPAAAEFFESLAKTYRKQYIYWTGSAKREATREKRIKEAIKLLLEKKKLGLK
jgi:uncharacterized protein YdeI (YjbR/CyaY-like superfamily)